jgi:hypothetical protein
MGHRDVGYENRRWTELSQDHVGFWVLVFGMKNYQVQLLREANTGWRKSHLRFSVENVVSGVK